jgi:hypothetical protein
MVPMPAEPAPEAAMPAPAPEMAQIKWFAGTWRCDGNVVATPFGPARKSRSTVAIRPDLGGFWYTGMVREDKTAQTPHPVQGMFHETYDPARKQFLLFWVDNHGGWATQTSRGWDGDRMVMEGEGALGGQTMGARDTFVKKAAGEMSHTSEVRIDGKWTVVSEEVCKKSPGPAPATQ